MNRFFSQPSQITEMVHWVGPDAPYENINPGDTVSILMPFYTGIFWADSHEYKVLAVERSAGIAILSHRESTFKVRIHYLVRRALGVPDA